jgi:hypothetical protein
MGVDGFESSVDSLDSFCALRQRQGGVAVAEAGAGAGAPGG